MSNGLELINKRIPVKKHRLFIDELFKCNMNQTKAYHNVYKGDYGNSRHNASRLVTNDNIKEEIERRLKEQAMSADEVIARLSEQARADYWEYIKNDGTVDLDRMIEDGKSHLIQGIKHDRNGKLIIDFPNSQSALVHIGKVQGLFTDKVDHNVTVVGTVLFKEAKVELPDNE